MTEPTKIKWLTVVEVLWANLGLGLVAYVVALAWPGWQMLTFPFCGLVVGSLLGLRLMRRLRRERQDRASLEMETLR